MTTFCDHGIVATTASIFDFFVTIFLLFVASKEKYVEDDDTRPYVAFSFECQKHNVR
jgi:hypothetical protein